MFLPGEAFAIKVIDRALEHVAEMKHNFRREVEIFNRLRHPGIIQLRAVQSDAQSAADSARQRPPRVLVGWLVGWLLALVVPPSVLTADGL